MFACVRPLQNEQSKRHERRIDDFTKRWSAVSDFMTAEHNNREDVKLEQMTSLHGSLVSYDVTHGSLMSYDVTARPAGGL